LVVSIPSRGFWFFEARLARLAACAACGFQSPHGDFGFLKPRIPLSINGTMVEFQSPHGDFGFLKAIADPAIYANPLHLFQSPHGDFGFLKKGEFSHFIGKEQKCFNPLTGILVF